MIDLSNYSCDKCAREFSRHCKHCWHTADKPPTKFKHKKKTGCETPGLRKPTPPPPPPTSGSNAVKPNPNYVPPASVAQPKTKESKTMYGLRLYIPFNELDTYIHEHIEATHKDHTFIPVKVEVNEIDLGIEISFVSAVPNETDGCRYQLDLNKLPKENN